MNTIYKLIRFNKICFIVIRLTLFLCHRAVYLCHDVSFWVHFRAVGRDVWVSGGWKMSVE